MTVDTDRALEIAMTLLEDTDRLALAGFSGRRGFDHKVDGTPVTDADVAIDRHLRDGLLAVFPDHAVLGDEDGGDFLPARPTWIVDPINATGNYVRGIEVFATLLALVVDDEAVMSVVNSPARRSRWWASENTGPTPVEPILTRNGGTALEGGDILTTNGLLHPATHDLLD